MKKLFVRLIKNLGWLGVTIGLLFLPALIFTLISRCYDYYQYTHLDRNLITEPDKVEIVFTFFAWGESNSGSPHKNLELTYTYRDEDDVKEIADILNAKTRSTIGGDKMPEYCPRIILYNGNKTNVFILGDSGPLLLYYTDAERWYELPPENAAELLMLLESLCPEKEDVASDSEYSIIQSWFDWAKGDLERQGIEWPDDAVTGEN